jgi:hypothetical protein
MIEEKNKEILIDKTENEEIFKLFIKFLYTGSFDYSNEETFLLFLIMANKVKNIFQKKYLCKSVKDFKVSPKKLLNGIISYMFFLLFNK